MFVVLDTISTNVTVYLLYCRPIR